jgi:hypothetical protein
LTEEKHAMPTPPQCLRRATTPVLVAVALISGAILVLGDRFDRTAGYAVTQPIRFEARIAACVADESMRLINPDHERCRPDERELVSGPAAPSGGPAVVATICLARR